MRFDDEGETPDDVLAAIALAASGVRKPTPRARRAAARSAAAQSLAPIESTIATGIAASVAAGLEREAPADSIARTAPHAPTAGLTAQLAASPFAAALQHVLPLAEVPAFDVRALFGARLAAMYLAGGFNEPTATAAVTPGERFVPTWDPAYVAPSVGASLAAAGAGTTSTTGTTAADAQPRLATGAAPQRAWVAPRSSLLAMPALGIDSSIDASRAASAASIDAALASAGAATGSNVVGALGPTPSAATSAAEALLATLTAPIASAAPISDARLATVPGALAKQMHDWSVVHERSTADLAFDFVDPELVLAARVYGLGPAEAAQAARLAIGGQSQIAAMASAIDQTFLAHAFDPRELQRRDAATTRDASSTASTASQGAPAAPSTAFPATALAPSTTAFGVHARPARGVTLWPAATVAALGLDAAAPDGNRSLAIAALEVLAARVVAELGTLATAASRGEPGALETSVGAGGASGGRVGAPAHDAMTPGATASSAGRAFGGALAPLVSGEQLEREIVTSTAASIAPAQRQRFEALYLALGQATSSRALSPAARAARALALVGRGGELVTARERAELAWGVLPQVFADSVSGIHGGGIPGGAAASGNPGIVGPGASRSAARSASAGEPRTWLDGGVDARPGLASLTARAGEALASYVTPTAAPVAAPGEAASGASSSSREAGAVLRAPTAAQELVRPGRPSGRHGGGEVEIPPWFEAAARKMFEDKGGSDPTFALSELTLVTSAPSSQIAASTRTPPAAAPPAPAASARSNGGEENQSIDIEKVANEVYRQILTLMDAARARNGEPYL
jgi:hypothetical protein